MENENEAQNTNDSETGNNEVVEAAQGHRIGPVAVVTIAVLALLFVLWYIIAIWMTPKDKPVVEPPLTQPTEEVEETVDLTVVPDRDSTVLGLRIDGTVGRLFTLPETGQTLYINKAGDCTNSCLEEWTPYVAAAPLEDAGDLSTLEREDTGELQYAWKGNGLYTYKEDTDRSFLGDGHSGTWRIARP